MSNYEDTVVDATFEYYQVWDTQPPPLPARSRLFRMEPVGIGTSQVECLTSYLARIAAEHCVSPRKLLCAEILSPIGKATHHYLTATHFPANQLNGMGKLADITVRGLEQLTIRQDLRHLTLLTWFNVLSGQSLLRTNRVWCASCYDENLCASELLYEPLIWSLEAVTICTKHYERLCDACPYCNKQLPFLATHYRPGYCSRCAKYLGNSGTAKSKQARLPVAEVEKSRQIQIQHIARGLLASPDISQPPPSSRHLTINLIKLINKIAKGNINLFSSVVDIWSGTIRRLLVPEAKISFSNLCQLCSRLNIKPTDLFFDQGNEEDIKRQQVVLRGDISLLRVITPWDEVEDTLKEALHEQPPPSLEAVARRMGYYPPKIKRHFTQLCEQIIFRYRGYQKSIHPPPKEVRTVFWAALKESPPPSLQKVLRRLGCHDTGYYYYSNYGSFC